MTAARRSKQPMPGATYRLRAIEDANAQLAELLTLLMLQEAARHTDASRCGICNGDAWQVARPSEVEALGSQVPRAVLRHQRIFYRCGVCAQVFWPMGGVKNRKADARGGGDKALRGPGEICGSEEAAAATVEWRPSCQLMMALGANSKRGQMLREARGLRTDLWTRLWEARPHGRSWRQLHY